jgi:anti-sigma factor RsiW
MTRDELIMLYHDGELAADESEQVRALIERDPAARRALERFELVGAELATLAVPKGVPDFADAVLARLATPDDAERALAPKPLAFAKTSRRSPARPLLLVSGALALAASVALVLTRPLVEPDADLAAPAAVVAAPEPDPPGESVAIERIDFGEDPGAIFLVPGSDERTVVIWTMDEATDNGPEVEL